LPTPNYTLKWGKNARETFEMFEAVYEEQAMGKTHVF
jgi:hypothetical protein